MRDPFSCTPTSEHRGRREFVCGPTGQVNVCFRRNFHELTNLRAHWKFLFWIGFARFCHIPAYLLQSIFPTNILVIVVSFSFVNFRLCRVLIDDALVAGLEDSAFFQDVRGARKSLRWHIAIRVVVLSYYLPEHSLNAKRYFSHLFPHSNLQSCDDLVCVFCARLCMSPSTDSTSIDRSLDSIGMRPYTIRNAKAKGQP